MGYPSLAMETTHLARYTRAEYVALERSSNVRHEFLDGAIHAMAGGTRGHVLASANVIASLNVALRGRPCAGSYSSHPSAASYASTMCTGIRWPGTDFGSLARHGPCDDGSHDRGGAGLP